MAQTGLFEKVKEKLFEKDVDRGLELADTLTEKRIMGNMLLELGKAKSEAFEAKTESA